MHFSIVDFVLFVAFFKTATADVETSNFQVHIPTNLTVRGGYDHRDALFGIPPYGGKIQQQVYYTNTTFCEAHTGKLQGFPQQQPWQSPFILMVDRGDCTFVQKVRYAQRAGAAAVIIADNICMCMHQGDCEMPPDQNECEEVEPIMADDGSGADISIPSFLLFKPDADRIKKVLIANQQMQVEMSFSVPSPDARVEYEFWTSPTDALSREFIDSFEFAPTALGEKAYFTPQMFVYDGSKIGCNTFIASCEGLCTNGGRYCAIAPENTDVLGVDIIAESLRQLCIWSLYGKENGIGREWWAYAKAFLNTCADLDQRMGKFKSDTCVQAAMKVSGVDNDKVDKCMAESGGVDQDVVNTLLETSIKAKSKSGAVILPSLFVNNGPVRGEMVFRNVFEAICSGYAKGSSPQICDECQHCQDAEECVEKGKCSSGSGIVVSGGVSSGTFFLSLLSVLAVSGGVGYVVYMRQQRYMRNQIRGIMAEYMPIDPSKASNGVDDDGNDNFSLT